MNIAAPGSPRRSRVTFAVPFFAASIALLAAPGCVPELGAINGKVFGTSVKIDDPRFGKSHSAGVPLRIEVSEDGDFAPGHVGRIVKKTFFSHTPPFVFNVSFACGSEGPDGGTYTDPRSIWFNVFVGYYEIDVSKARWGRPFGYRITGDEVRIVLDDLLRIGKADWNYFSNYLYGVPIEDVRPHDALSEGRAQYLGRKKVGAREWDFVELTGVEVVSAYLSGADGKSLVDNAPLWTSLWQKEFGRPHPRPDFPKSFIPTRMRAKIYMSYTEGIDPHTHERVYRTTIFGGTTNDTYRHRIDNRRFIQVQLHALEEVIQRMYPDLGFL